MSWDAKLFNRQLATRRFGREVRHFEEIDSTNSWLAMNHGEFILTGAVAVADHQTNGRGRQERTWLDVPERSLLCSVLLKFGVATDGLEWLSLLPALALSRVLQRRVGTTCRVSLKWPNDVQLNDRKVAGILGQSSVQGASRIVVLGIGCNVTLPRAELPEEFRARATSILDESGAEITREVLLAELLGELELLFDEWCEQRFDAIKAAWEQFGPARGTELSRGEQDNLAVGRYAGLGNRGQLLLADPDGNIHEVFSGDVFG